MALMDKINDTVAAGMRDGLPNGRNIDNLVDWHSAIAKKVHDILLGWEEQGFIEVYVDLPGKLLDTPIRIKFPPKKV